MDRSIFAVLLVPGAIVLGSCSCELEPSDDCAWEDKWPYYDYLNNNQCMDPSQDGCLELTSYLATRSDGRQVHVDGVYRWRDARARWQDPDGTERDHLLTHFVLQYMRELRKTYNKCPSDYFHTQLFNQIDYAISQAVEYPIHLDCVLPVLVWENRYGVAHAMEQAEMAAFLASAARAYAKHGAPEARGTMRYAFQAIESLFIPVGVHTGGVCSMVQDECGAKKARFRKGFWFHSRGVVIDTANEDLIPTVLNQHLHAIYETLSMYLSVSKRPDLVPGEYSSAEEALARLEDRAIGGLYQLAFSNGNNSAAPQRPPNIAQFMDLGEQPFSSAPYYFSYYRFDLSDRTFRNIAWPRTCHYHTHTLKKLADIRQILDDNYNVFANSPSNEGWRLYEAVDRLFEGQGEPRGQSGSTNAVWQFWLAQQVKYDVVHCPTCRDDDNDVIPCEGDEAVADLFPHDWTSH
jgi:hypothetical protein